MPAGEVAKAEQSPAFGIAAAASTLPGVPILKIRGRPIEVVGRTLKPPEISFVLINWNYGHFVGEAIDSIRQQDYPHFECVVVDNGSTDSSRAVIARHVQGDPRFSVHHLPENLGQLGAVLWALERISGDFVTFVDADDVLFPEFASTHLQVHLAAPRNVAITTSDIVDIGPEGKLLSGGYIASNTTDNSKHAIKGLRPAAAVTRFSTISDEFYQKLSELTLTLPNWTGGWNWAPGTSNMFRRSILEMVRIKSETGRELKAADNHFNSISHAVGGTAVINLPLCGYRQHGDNFFSSHVSFHGIKRGNRLQAEKNSIDTRQSIEVLLDQVDHFSWLLSIRYWTALDQLTRASKAELRAYYRHPTSVAVFTHHMEKLRTAFGDERLIEEIRRRFSMNVAHRMFETGLNGGMPSSFRRKLIVFELRRFIHKKILRRK